MLLFPQLTPFRYLLINYRIGGLMLRVADFDRKVVIDKAREAYERHLSLLDHYEILSEAEKKSYLAYNEDPAKFSTISITNPTARRAAKIANFKQESELKRKLQVYFLFTMYKAVADFIPVPCPEPSVLTKRRRCHSRIAPYKSALMCARYFSVIGDNEQRARGPSDGATYSICRP
jgi:hypothetical protein